MSQLTSLARDNDKPADVASQIIYVGPFGGQWGSLGKMCLSVGVTVTRLLNSCQPGDFVHKLLVEYAKFADTDHM